MRYNIFLPLRKETVMKAKNRERLGLGIKIGAGVVAVIMIIGVIMQGFMYF